MAALYLLREQYEDAVRLPRIGLDKVNRGRNERTRYQSTEDFTRDLMARAGAVGSFAVNSGLISSEELLAVMREFYSDHPEFTAEQ
jgi:hypothetical protein